MSVNKKEALELAKNSKGISTVTHSQKMKRKL